ncbi:dihydroorotase [Pseudonocardia pini]|uniref:dihydroorotase n=1 Tax=Pseudonocardia pini TaxID=2758030 RepID=UPI0015F1117D|nr:amidohydrolase family protein [Pseudonocardia pini]
MERFDLIVEGGQVLLPGDGLTEAAVAVREGRIAALLPPGTTADATERLDATGRVVLPGAIDAHIHLGASITVPSEAEEVGTETRSAVVGGVTTVLGYLMSAEPYEELFEPAIKLFEQASYTDFGVHFVIGTPHQLEMLPRYVNELGVSSFKFFMNFRGTEGAYLGLPGNDDGFLWDLLRAAAPLGAMVNPHPENIEVVWRTREAAQANPPADPLQAWGASRPPVVEAEAISRAAMFAAESGTSLFSVHTSSRLALEAIADRRNRQSGIYVETCPHYLVLDEESGVGTYGKVNPPLRTAEDREALWTALERGEIDVVGSDHVPRHRSAKEKDIWSASAGFPGMETLLPVMLSEGHLRRGIPLERIVEVVSTNPAKIFGMYPRKGRIAPGADADLAIVDLDAPRTLSNDTVVSAAAYTPYSGLEVGVSVTDTVVGGRVVVRGGEVVAGPAGGYVHRAASGATAVEATRTHSAGRSA